MMRRNCYVFACITIFDCCICIFSSFEMIGRSCETDKCRSCVCSANVSVIDCKVFNGNRSTVEYVRNKTYALISPTCCTGYIVVNTIYSIAITVDITLERFVEIPDICGITKCNFTCFPVNIIGSVKVNIGCEFIGSACFAAIIDNVCEFFGCADFANAVAVSGRIRCCSVPNCFVYVYFVA